MITPTLHISTEASYFCRRSTSGAVYPGVPSEVFSVPCSATEEKPKSESLMEAREALLRDAAAARLLHQQDVLRLQVAVDDAVLVAVGDGGDEAAHDGLRVALGELRALLDVVEEAAARRELLA